MAFDTNNGNQQSPWSLRVQNANRYYETWESRFRCTVLEEYVRGFQWKYKKDFNSINYNPYTLNLFYSTIKIKLSSLLFQKPKFLITPAPGNGSNWDMDFAMQSAQIKEDVLNTIIRNPNMNFAKHIKRAAKDSYTRFGLIEVGYSADWRNPQKEIPQLKSWDNSDVPEDKDRVVRNEEVPTKERLFIKRINPKRFRVSISEAIDLNDHEWYGYYDFVYTRELQKTPGITWPKSYEGGSLGANYSGGILGDVFDSQNRSQYTGLSDGKVSKVWRIWDEVSKTQYLFLDDWFQEPLWEAPFERSGLVDIRWDEDTEGFYPVPPTFQWVSQQDEINEAREQTRSYRRRFTRKFQYVEGTIDDLEVEKFASGPDGVLIKVKRENAISPIENPEQGQTAENALLLAKDDFNTVSGTSAEARNQADRETAAAAKITEARASIRESAEQMDFSTFIELIGREVLATAKERLVEGLWIQDSSGAIQDPLTMLQIKQPTYKWIRAQDLTDGYDETIVADVENQSPQAMAAENQSFAQFLTYVHNFPEISLDPDLIREAAYRCGYRNEKIIQKMQKTALIQLAAKAAAMNPGMAGGSQIQAEQGQNGDNIATNNMQNMNPDSPTQMNQKLLEQVH